MLHDDSCRNSLENFNIDLSWFTITGMSVSGWDLWCKIAPNRKKNEISHHQRYLMIRNSSIYYYIFFSSKKMFVVPLTFSADLVYLPSSLNLVGSHSWKIHVLHYSLQSDMIFSTRTQQKSSWKILWLCFKKENSVYSCGI